MPARGRNRDKRVAVEFKTGRSKQYGATPPNVVERIVELGRVLDEANVPPGDRYVPFSPPTQGTYEFLNEAGTINQEAYDRAIERVTRVREGQAAAHVRDHHEVPPEPTHPTFSVDTYQEPE
jgi:hypothetical protein